MTKYVKKSDYDTKVGNLENKIKTAESKPNISNLATETGLKNLENKTLIVMLLLKKTDYTTEKNCIANDYATKSS